GHDPRLEGLVQLALLADLLEDDRAPLLQLPQVAQPLLEGAQLRVVQPAGGLLAVPGDERHGGAAVQQVDRRRHLVRAHPELVGDALRDRMGSEGGGLLLRGRERRACHPHIVPVAGAAARRGVGAQGSSRSISSTAPAVPPCSRSSRRIWAARCATSAEPVSSSRLVRSSSAVTVSESTRRATPAATSASALPNWSTACGAAIIGVPVHSPSHDPPMPAWVTNASACSRMASCGTQGCTSTEAGTSPSAAGSTCLPICRTVCQPGRSPKAVMHRR